MSDTEEMVWQEELPGEATPEEATSEEIIPEVSVPERLVKNYFRSLVNCYFKILPIRESEAECEEKTAGVYLESLKAEMLGCGALLQEIQYDPVYMTLLSILQYFIDHPDCEIAQVKREVFRAIRICNKIAQKYAQEVRP